MSTIGKALIWSSVGLIVLGGILWIVGANQLAAHQLQDAFGGFGSNTPGDAWMIGWGIGLLVIGVLLLVIFWAVRAATTRPQVEVEPPTLSERMREREAEERG